MPEFFTQGLDPKAYFARRIREQAKYENLQLTDLETQYLNLSEQGEDKTAYEMLEKGKAFEEFDSRISGLAWRAYQQDISAYSGAEECYHNAIRALARVDDYPNLGMFVSCIALRTSPEKLKGSWWPAVLLLVLFLVLALLCFLRVKG